MKKGDMVLSCTTPVIGGLIWQNVFLAMLIMLLIVSLSYMLGNLLRREEYIEFSKRELYNVFVTGALVASFTTIVAIANELSCSTANGASLFERAVEGMNTVVYSEVYPILRNLFMMMLEISALSNMTVVTFSIKFNPLGGLKYFYTSLNVVSFILESVFASLYIQSLLLIVLKETAFSITMPVGIFLRAFPMTRDAGTFLMALALSLYTIYPYIYVVSLDTYKAVITQITYDDIASGIHTTPSIWTKFFSGVENKIFYVLTAFNYDGIRDMFLSLGGHLFLAIAIPALAIILSVAMANSILKFIKEVSA